MGGVTNVEVCWRLLLGRLERQGAFRSLIGRGAAAHRAVRSRLAGARARLGRAARGAWRDRLPGARARLAQAARRASGAAKRLPAALADRRRAVRFAALAFLLLAAAPVAAAGLEALARARFSPAAARAPTRFYARPPAIDLGATPDRREVEGHLGRLGYSSASGEVRQGEYALGRRRWVIGRRPFRIGERVVPGGAAVVSLDGGGRVEGLEDAAGRRLSTLLLEPEPIGALFGGTKQDRIPVRLGEVPASLIAAVLAVEDRRFYQHAGLDLRRIAAAAFSNLRAGRVVQGGSTLTQQLAKNLFLGPERTWSRKLREAAMALVLELRHSKDEILEAYLNEIYLGQDGAVAIHGVGRAARRYFGKDASELELSESALLAGLIRGPSLFSPFRDPEGARRRRDLVLRLLRERGAIPEEVYRRALEAPVGAREETPPPSGSPWFVRWVEGGLRDTAGGSGGEGLGGRGLTVLTTLDPRLQRAAAEAVREGLERAERNARIARASEEGARLQAALVALDPRSGDVLAMVGGRDFGGSQFNRAAAARRQPGSAFKPIVALAALSRPLAGREGSFTLATVLDDEPLEVRTPAGPWQPVNYDGSFRGPVTLREALELSLNVPFARLGLALGPERIATAARALGIESPLRAVPSLALGASEVTLLELSRAYAVLAAEGRRPELRSTSAVFDAGGRRVAQRARAAGGGDGEGDRASGAAAGPARVFEPQEVYLVTSALRGAVERGTGQSLRRLGFYGDVAAKSGTTNDFRDAWFLGYTPGLAVGVWVGFDDGRSVGLSGAGAALPIFARFLIEAVGAYGDRGPYGSAGFERPPGLEIAEVDPLTGLRAGPGCPGLPEIFVEGTAPEEICYPYWWTPERWWRRGRTAPEAGAPEADARRLERMLRGLDARRARDLGPLFESFGRDLLRELEREASVRSEARE